MTALKHDGVSVTSENDVDSIWEEDLCGFNKRNFTLLTQKSDRGMIK